MSSYSKASKIFDTSFDSDLYFESIAAEFTKNSLLKAIGSREIPLLFLLGEPGVGKTYMLNVLQNYFSADKKVLFSSEPFSTPESFLHFLLKNEYFDKRLTISELKDEAMNRFNSTDNLIIIDEAQLVDNLVLEFIRILSDTGHFNFLLSMHKREGEEIVKKSHFASRTHTVVELTMLTKSEIKKYIESELLRHGLGNISEIFNQSDVKFIQKLSNGNFRIVKQLLKHTFSIMDYAKINGHDSYAKPNECVITMAAIDLGIINA
ncbi:MAG: ATP-binding protein [Campylobacterota bacterium]|nr:ATP-binding protein [Campylobacterota bacterium]